LRQKEVQARGEKSYLQVNAFEGTFLQEFRFYDESLFPWS